MKVVPEKVLYRVYGKGQTDEAADVDPCVAIERLVKFHADALGCRVTLEKLNERWYTISVMADLEDPNSTFSTMVLVGSPEALSAPVLLARMMARETGACRQFATAVQYALAAGERDTIPAPEAP